MKQENGAVPSDVETSDSNTKLIKMLAFLKISAAVQMKQYKPDTPWCYQLSGCKYKQGTTRLLQLIL